MRLCCTRGVIALSDSPSRPSASGRTAGLLIRIGATAAVDYPGLSAGGAGRGRPSITAKNIIEATPLIGRPNCNLNTNLPRRMEIDWADAAATGRHNGRVRGHAEARPASANWFVPKLWDDSRRPPRVAGGANHPAPPAPSEHNPYFGRYLPSGAGRAPTAARAKLVRPSRALSRLRRTLATLASCRRRAAAGPRR